MFNPNIDILYTFELWYLKTPYMCLTNNVIYSFSVKIMNMDFLNELEIFHFVSNLDVIIIHIINESLYFQNNQDW